MHAWLALVDAESCRPLRGTLNNAGTRRVEEYNAYFDRPAQQEHRRPMTSAGTTHNVEDNKRRFAGQIVEWLQKKAKEQWIDSLVIPASPRMLGVHWIAPLGSRLGSTPGQGWRAASD